MLGLLVSLLILLVIFAIVWWIITMIPIPPDFVWIVRVIMAVIFLICLIALLTGNFPVYGNGYHYPLR